MQDLTLPTALPLFTLDQKGVVNFWNTACELQTGLAESEVLHTRRHWRAFISVPVLCWRICCCTVMKQVWKKRIELL